MNESTNEKTTIYQFEELFLLTVKNNLPDNKKKNKIKRWQENQEQKSGATTSWTCNIRSLQNDE